MICLLCCSHSSDIIDLNSEQGRQSKIPSVLFKYFRFLFETEPDTGEICHKCWLKVEMFHEFYQRIEEIHIVQDDTVIVETLEPIIKSDDEFSDDDFNNDIFNDGGFNDDFDDLSPNEDIKHSAVLYPETESNVENSTPQIDLPDIPNIVLADIKTENQNSAEPTSNKKIKAKADVNRKGTNENDKDTFYTKVKSKKYKWTYKCDLCKETFIKTVDIKEHLKTKHELNVLCSICNKTFLNAKTLRTHLHLFHERPQEEKPTPPSRKRPKPQFKSIKCNECSEYFLAEEHLLKHQKMTHLALPFKCTHAQCKESFETAQLLDEHKQKAHAKVPCHFCSKKITPQFLDMHVQRMHIKAFQTICEQCGKVFPDETSRKYHIKMEHEHPDKLICDICGDAFKCRATIRNHMIHVHVQGPQKCLICGKMLANGRTLQKHQRVHNDALKDKYKCNICNKGFRDSTKLREHSYIHTGKTDAYICQFCGKNFRFGSSFSAHRMKYHPAEMAHVKEQLQKRRNWKLKKL